MYTSNEIESLLESFNNSILPKSHWTHEAHLVMAIWYTSKYSHSEALDIVRRKIILLNEFHGTPNSDTEGYHETLTIFWLLNAEQFVHENSNIVLFNICNSFIMSNKGNRSYPLEFYTHEILFSKEARKKWVKPNKKNIVRVNMGYDK